MGQPSVRSSSTFVTCTNKDVDCLQIHGHRSGPSSNRTLISEQYPSHSNLGSPLLSSKSSNLDPSSSPYKASPAHYAVTLSNSYTSPTPTHRTLPSVPIGSTADSPSLSTRSSTNTSFYHEANPTLPTLLSDSASVKSDDSSIFSDGHLHPSQQGTTSTPTRHHDPSSNVKGRLQHGNISVSSAGKFIHSWTRTTSLSIGTTVSSTGGGGLPIDRAPSPSPSLISEREREENERVERELESKRKRLQIYVFVCRCVAYPFNSKQSSDMARKHLKVTLVQYGVIKERFLAFLNGKTRIEADEGKPLRRMSSVRTRSSAFSVYQCCSFVLRSISQK